jgi:cysteine-rich repeat protein
MRTPPVLLGALLWPLAACFVDPGSYASASVTAATSSSTSTSTDTSTTQALTAPTDTGLSDTATTGLATTTSSTDPVTTDPVTTDPVTTDPVTTDPVTTDPVTTDPIAVCGDGLLGGAETCDDGNQNDGDGCSALCQQEPRGKLYVFATLGKFNGDINGLDQADVKCQSEAENHDLPGTYYAWISVSPEQCPASRFAAHGMRYVLPGNDEPVVAFGTAQLLSNNHERGIDRGPNGATLDVPDDCDPDGLAWTGTNNDGTLNGNTCKGFTTASFGELALAGKVVASGTGWSAGCAVPCSVSLRLYCMQQP